MLYGTGDALAFLVASTAGDEVTGSGTVSYADGSRVDVRARRARLAPGPARHQGVALPHVNTPGGQLAEKARLYVVTVPIVPGRALASVQLPRATDLHVFALSVRTAAPAGQAAGRRRRPVTRPWGRGPTGHCGWWCTPRRAGRWCGCASTTPSQRLRYRSGARRWPCSGRARRPGHAGAGDLGRAAGVEVPAGAQVYSDPLAFDVPADTNLLVSFHLPGTVPAAPVHRLAQQRRI
ncbi:hypothetical protein [Streptomyces sp. F001]|uniref:hypothetical protein n=1 Tax=Streptomyces sp. F001 TaxID=1510026 RepID=UPI00101E77BC|nr:hypothetical protein [Streptomyces sp. F001]